MSDVINQDIELQTMQVIVQSLKFLEPEQQVRVLWYLNERFKGGEKNG